MQLTCAKLIDQLIKAFDQLFILFPPSFSAIIKSLGVVTDWLLGILLLAGVCHGVMLRVLRAYIMRGRFPGYLLITLAIHSFIALIGGAARLSKASVTPNDYWPSTPISV